MQPKALLNILEEADEFEIEGMVEIDVLNNGTILKDTTDEITLVHPLSP